MPMTFEMKAGGGIAEGAYQAEFVRAEEYKENADQYGIGVLLVWKVLEGELAGEEASRIVSAKLSAKTNLYKFIQAMKGGPLEPSQKIDLEEFYGAKGMIVVETCGADGSSTRVSTFLKS